MKEYALKKVKYYGKSVKMLERYRSIFVYILLVVGVIDIVFEAIANPLNPITFSLSCIYAMLLFLSVFSFYLLDKWAFIITLLAISLKCVWVSITSVTSIISMFSIMGVASSTANSFSNSMGDASVSAGANIALGAVNGGIMMGTIIATAVNAFVVAFFVIIIVNMIKHRVLFFTDFSVLKEKYETD